MEEKNKKQKSQNILNFKFSIWFNSLVLIILISLSSSKAIDFQLTETCLDLPFNLCGSKGKIMMSPLNNHKKLVGWWSFDDKFAHDYSGNNLDGVPIPEVGPSSFVKGYSAHFNGTQMMTINNHVDFIESSDMSLSFWIYLLEDSTGNWRTLIHKGDSIQELTPTIMFWPKERRLHVRVSTEVFWNEGLESRALINMKQWVFVTVIASGQMLQLYINGNLDNQVILRGKVKFNNGNFHIGKDPWHPGVKCFLDELKIYKTALRSKEIEADASISNPLIGPTYTTLGCENCPFVQALSSCQEKYHLCSYAELYSGGYLVARRNGWFKFNTEVWARESQTELQKLSENTGNEVGNPNILKMALCCSDF